MSPTGPGMKLVAPPQPTVGPEHIQHAKTIIRMARGHRYRTASANAAFQHPGFYDLVRSASRTAQAGRFEWIWTWVDLNKGRDDRPELVAACSALLRALPMVEAEPDDPEPEPGPPARYSLDMVPTEVFFAETYDLQWLARGALVSGEACVVGGPAKALKTSILIDLAISLASGTPLLGRFPVPGRMPVGFISGESGRRVIQANAREVCIARDLPFADASGVLWGFKLPQLSNAEHLATIRTTIADNGLKVLILDPLYLALLAGNAGVDAANMFQMGPLLAEVAATCLESGATPILAHHSVKRRENAFEPMELEELAFAGINQYCRQWLLVSRRERYDEPSGIHKLHLKYGGSAGHSGLLHVDVDTGKLDDDFRGRRWVVTTASPHESIAAVRQDSRAAGEQAELARQREAAARKEQQLELDSDKCLRAIEALAARGPIKEANVSNVAMQAMLSGAQAKLALYHLQMAGRIEEIEPISTPGKRGRKSPTYRIPAPKPPASWEEQP